MNDDATSTDVRPSSRVPVKTAFGASNRARLIDQYFDARVPGVLPAEDAWKHVYRLLLWVDQTTGLAHCYESDKSQPGKRWYARSLSFHDWVCTALGVAPGDLSKEVDWLFLRASENLAAYVLLQTTEVAAKAKRQREPYEGRGFPRPGEDPELVDIVRSGLGQYLSTEPPQPIWDVLIERIRQYLALENKRKNLVGEGFEDVIAQVVQRACGSSMTVHTRRALHDLPGFNRVRAGDKPNKVDVAVLRPDMRTLITAKWSVRADREKQFITDFTDYVTAESDRKPFQYLFVTNEFDPARLVRACEQLSGNAPLFTSVIHINTDALRATYGPAAETGDEAASMKRVLGHIDTGRLISLSEWLRALKGV